jgi:hypothetical protein
MNVYLVSYTDGQRASVKASSIEGARNKGYQLNRSGVIASIDKV